MCYTSEKQSKNISDSAKTYINVSPNNVSVNRYITATVNYTDVTGNITFIVNNKEYTVGIINGVARVNVTNLNTSANKTITAKYSGDYKYINSSTTAILNISKVPGNANIIVHNITAGETETVFINLPSDTSNGTITVRFNNEIVNDRGAVLQLGGLYEKVHRIPPARRRGRGDHHRQRRLDGRDAGDRREVPG